MFLGAILLCAQKSWWKVILPEQRRPNGERIYWGGSYTQTTGRTAVHVGSRWSQVPWTVPVASLVFTAFWKLSFSIYEHFCSFCQKVSLGVRVCVCMSDWPDLVHRSLVGGSGNYDGSPFMASWMECRRDASKGSECVSQKKWTNLKTRYTQPFPSSFI